MGDEPFQAPAALAATGGGLLVVQRFEWAQARGAPGGHNRGEDGHQGDDAEQSGRHHELGCPIPRAIRSPARERESERRPDERRHHALVAHHPLDLAAGHPDRAAFPIPS